MSSAVSAWPIQRMQCASRAGPSRYWPSRWPCPRPPSMLAAGTRRSSIRISQWLWPPAIVWTSRTTVQPSDGQVDDEARVAGLRDLGVLLGAGDEQRELRAAGAGDEPLVAVDDPLVAVGVGERLDQRRVGAGDLRLGHREARAGRAVAQRAEVLLLLLVGRPVQQRVLIALVGRLGVEHERPDRHLGGLRRHGGHRRRAERPSRPTRPACAAATAATPRAPPCGAGGSSSRPRTRVLWSVASHSGRTRLSMKSRTLRRTSSTSGGNEKSIMRRVWHAGPSRRAPG